MSVCSFASVTAGGGGGGGGAGFGVIWPRSSPPLFAGVCTSTYQPLLLKSVRSAAATGCNSADQRPSCTLSFVRVSNAVALFAPAAALCTCASVASSTPLDTMLTVAVLAFVSIVVAAVPLAAVVTAGTSFAP